VVVPCSPSSGCLNGFSQSRNWPIGFDHNGQIVVWEEEEDDYWDGLPLDWAMDGDFGEEAMAILMLEQLCTLWNIKYVQLCTFLVA
jgi:hypothetical protein